jgi:release factor glutamine methyltransferase
MTLKQALSYARETLAANSVQEFIIESELLLRHTLKIDRIQLYTGLDRELSPEQLKEFHRLVQRRLNQEPVAYITGHREFYGFDFYVDSNVLIPRSESELLVEKTLEFAHKHPLSTIAEIGTGCGAIAISLALNLSQTRIYATDISASALKVALSNCEKYGVVDRVVLLEGDMLDPLPEPVDLIVANLPYVKVSELSGINTYNFEPSLALNGGIDGLEKIRRLACKITDKLNSGGFLFLEIGQGQAGGVTTFLHSLFPTSMIEVIPDLSGIERVVSLNLR